MNKALTILLIIASTTAMLAQTLPRTLTVKGEEYSGVFYKGRDEARVKFTHDAGFATVLIADLPPDVQKDFPVDSAKAAQQLQDDAKRQNEVARAQAENARVQAVKLAAAENAQKQNELLDKICYTLLAEIVQISNGGALVKVVRIYQDDPKRGRLDATATVLQSGEPVFVLGKFNSEVDGEQWQGVVWLAGKHRYTTVSGASKTVKAFATSKEEALNNIQE